MELADHIRTNCPHLELSGLMTIGAAERSCSDNTINPDFEVSRTILDFYKYVTMTKIHFEKRKENN